MLTVITNRLGDVILLVVIGLILCEGDLYFQGISVRSSRISHKEVGRWLILALFTKRAQIPFSSWLPAAMAAPTPVSSLVHSSTLVTAGVYLYFRFMARFKCIFVAWFGLLTLIMAGLAALAERDIKKVVALSTLRQLGLIIVRIGCGLKLAGFYHLVLHGYFKALLFVSVGNIIHLSDDYQDFRKISSYESRFRVTLRMCMFANLRLIGVPFIRGFLSKDLVLELLRTSYTRATLYFGLFYVGCILTRVYRARFIYLRVFCVYKSKRSIVKFRDAREFYGRSLILWRIRALGGGTLG